MKINMKDCLVIGTLAIIALLFLFFIIYTGVMLIIWIIAGGAILGLYALWDRFLKPWLLKHEENYDILDDRKK